MLSKPISNNPWPCLRWIQQEEKTFEGRLRPKVIEWGLSVGTIMHFFDLTDPHSWVICRVTTLLEFKDFGEAFDALGSSLIPGHTKEEVIRLYNIFQKAEDEDLDILGSTPCRAIRENGVVAIGILVL